MYDLDGWHEVGCTTSDGLRDTKKIVSSSLSDPDGQYSDGGIFYTEWATPDGVPFLRDYRYLDERPCKHYERNSWDDITKGADW